MSCCKKEFTTCMHGAFGSCHDLGSCVIWWHKFDWILWFGKINPSKYLIQMFYKFINMKISSSKTPEIKASAIYKPSLGAI
jgi:hypothetical protein